MYNLAFNRARGHSMEKYTEDLLKRTSISYVDENSKMKFNFSICIF